MSAADVRVYKMPKNCISKHNVISNVMKKQQINQNLLKCHIVMLRRHGTLISEMESLGGSSRAVVVRAYGKSCMGGETIRCTTAVYHPMSNDLKKEQTLIHIIPHDQRNTTAEITSSYNNEKQALLLNRQNSAHCCILLYAACN